MCYKHVIKFSPSSFLQTQFPVNFSSNQFFQPYLINSSTCFDIYFINASTINHQFSYLILIYFFNFSIDLSIDFLIHFTFSQKSPPPPSCSQMSTPALLSVRKSLLLTAQAEGDKEKLEWVDQARGRTRFVPAHRETPRSRQFRVSTTYSYARNSVIWVA